MSLPPYPGYQPNQLATKVGGLHRSIVLLEIFTEHEPDALEFAKLDEQLGLLLEKQPWVEKSQVVGQGRFTVRLSRALNLEGHKDVG